MFYEPDGIPQFFPSAFGFIHRREQITGSSSQIVFDCSGTIRAVKGAEWMAAVPLVVFGVETRLTWAIGFPALPHPEPSQRSQTQEQLPDLGPPASLERGKFTAGSCSALPGGT